MCVCVCKVIFLCYRSDPILVANLGGLSGLLLLFLPLVVPIPGPLAVPLRLDCFPSWAFLSSEVGRTKAITMES